MRGDSTGSSSGRSSGRFGDGARGEGYLAFSRRPLQILFFLLPLIVGYELCLALLLRSGDGRTIATVEAHRQLLVVFNKFGIAPTGGLYLGGAAIVVVLLVWHVLRRDRWRVRGSVALGMAVESTGLAAPLLVAGAVIASGTLLTGAPATDPGSGLRELGVGSRIAISIGAGLYEELAFRMVLIAVLHGLLVDVGRLPEAVGVTVAVLVSAVLFTCYHDLHGPDGAIAMTRVVFLLVAGLYFGLLYAVRGFGIVVGVHAVYDIIAVLLGGE